MLLEACGFSMNDETNQFLFRGEVRSYWRLVARGAPKWSPIQHRHTDRKFDFRLDENGLAVRDAGIISPMECTLSAGCLLYRFVGTAAYSKDKVRSVFGHWWIDHDVWILLSYEAKRLGEGLETVSQRYLALPEDWGDRGRVACGRLSKPLMAWRGNGEVAHGKISGTVTPTQHNKAVQLCIPGDPEVIAGAFGGKEFVRSMYTRDALKALS
jgi:hypothetical protein